MYNENNIFVKIIEKEIPAKIIYEDNEILAFEDINPSAKIHVLIIPKQKKYKSFDDFISNANQEDIASFFNKVRKVAHELNLASTGYRIITNHGDNACQTVHHFHIHLLGGEQLEGF